jgi:hypothetical protein
VGQAKRAFENRKKPLTFAGLQKAELLHLLHCFRDINIVRRGDKFLRLNDLLAEVLELNEQLLDVIRRVFIEELVSYSCTSRIMSTLRYRSMFKSDDLPQKPEQHVCEVGHDQFRLRKCVLVSNVDYEIGVRELFSLVFDLYGCRVERNPSIVVLVPIKASLSVHKVYDK